MPAGVDELVVARRVHEKRLDVLVSRFKVDGVIFTRNRRVEG